MLVQNNGWLSMDYTVLYSVRGNSLYPLVREPQIILCYNHRCENLKSYYVITTGARTSNHTVITTGCENLKSYCVITNGARTSNHTLL
jgi:hypothetical protein